MGEGEQMNEALYMKCIVTGARGTIGSPLCDQLVERGHHVLQWDRNTVPVDDPTAMEQFLTSENPDGVFHLAVASQSTGRPNEGHVVNVEWPHHLARITASLGISFVFTSTVMVFSDDAKGPFTVKSTPDAEGGYGGEKREAERLVIEAHPAAHVIRLGWQIGESQGTNTMLHFFDQKMREEGKVSASSKWLPACSFLPDTVRALADLPGHPPGLYQFNSNSEWNFFEIASALSAERGGRWQIEENQDFVYDQRMVDDRLLPPPLSEGLAALRG